MTQHPRYYSFYLLTLHAALLLFLSFYFLAREEYLLHYLEQNLPLQFLFRFCAFWFVSFLLTLLVFMIYVQRYQIQIPRVGKSYAVQAGKYAFSIGAGSAFMFLVLLYFVFLN